MCALMGEWISGPEMAELLHISRQALHKQTPMIAHDGLARRHGRRWLYSREQVLRHYDAYISHWRWDSPRDAYR